MKKIAFIALILITFLSVAKEPATQSPYVEGMHYSLIEPFYETGNDKKVIVYEFFSYRCPHCATFQPYMDALHENLPDYAEIKLVPLGFQPSWIVFAKAYYTAESMGILDKSHQAIFDALHKQHKKLRSIEDVAAWYAENFAVDKDKFLSTANSFMVDSMIKSGNNIAVKMKVPNTPKLVINGKFMPQVKALGSNNGVIELTRYLIDEEAKRMGLIK